MTNWYADLQEKPLLRSYRLYKREFIPECYLDCITLPKYHIPISKIRASSHDLAIERGRHAYTTNDWPKPKTLYVLHWNWKRRTFCNQLPYEYSWASKIIYTGLFPAFAEINNHEKWYISCHAKTARYWHCLEIFYTNHSISATKKSMGRVFPPNSDILPRHAD